MINIKTKIKKSLINLILNIKHCVCCQGFNNTIERLAGKEICQEYLRCAGDSGLFRGRGRSAEVQSEAVAGGRPVSGVDAAGKGKQP